MRTVKYGKYIIQEDGKVFDNNYKSYIEPHINSSGIPTVRLYIGNRYRNYNLAKLIAESFLGSTPTGVVYVLTYKDNDKTNCALSNLEYTKGTVIAENKHADAVPDIPVKAYDPYTFNEVEFSSISEAVIYLRSIAATDDSDSRIKINIFNSTTSGELTYNYKWFIL